MFKCAIFHIIHLFPGYEAFSTHIIGNHRYVFQVQVLLPDTQTRLKRSESPPLVLQPRTSQV